MITKADKPQNPQSESAIWDLREPKMKFQSKSGGLRARRAKWYNSSLKAGRPKTRDKLMCQFFWRQEKADIPIWRQVEGNLSYLDVNLPLYSISAFNGLDKAHLH